MPGASAVEADVLIKRSTTLTTVKGRQSMPQKPDEDIDLALIQELMFTARGLQLTRFSQAETLAGKTPDFRVSQAGKLVAFCEAKSPRDDWLDDQLDTAEPLELVGGLRNDPIFNRIARHVKKAAAQFDAVNEARTLPNILVFVNHDRASNYNDLRETLTGMFHAAGGERFPTMTHISEGRLRMTKYRIDLYAWIDAQTHRVQGYVFCEASPDYRKALCNLLALDASKIKY